MLAMNGQRVRSLREEKGLTKRCLAALAGISEVTARKVERGQPVRLSTGRAVAEALGVEPSPNLGRVLGRE